MIVAAGVLCRLPMRLPEVEGIDLWPGQPRGIYVPMPIPEPEPEEGEGDGEGEDVADLAGTAS